MKQDYRPSEKAAEIIMKDLIDCLLVEGFFKESKCRIYDTYEWDSYINNNNLKSCKLFKVEEDNPKIYAYTFNKKTLVFLIKPSITQEWEKIQKSNVYIIENKEISFSKIDPTALIQYIFDSQKEKFLEKQDGVDRVINTLQESIIQTSWSINHSIKTKNIINKNTYDFFQILEQLASLRDRPYHPLSKAKIGINKEEYHTYISEFDKEITLNWVAIHKDKIMYGLDNPKFNNKTPSDYFLSDIERNTLEDELKSLDIENSHIAIPIHPWQLTYVTKKVLKEAFHSGECHTLSFTSRPFYSTSSLRSMAPSWKTNYYLKLPMSIYSLASSRFLPAIKMINGQKSEQLLRQGLTLDKELEKKLYLCNESVWWAYLPKETKDYSPNNEVLFTQPPRHLSAMLRIYPKDLMDSQEIRLIPMASLGSFLPNKSYHFFDDWLTYRNLKKSSSNIKKLFKELSYTFIEINLRMFKIGMLGEVHGQNSVLIWNKGYITGLLLRDHDSLRIYVPWLKKNGMNDPSYTIKKDYPNTLYHEKAEDLFFYFQTLAIQVNIRSIIDTISSIYNINPIELWFELKTVILQSINDIKFDKNTEKMIYRLLFEEKKWPFKMLLKPMIDRGNDPGSMPSGKGTIPNPFLRISELRKEKKS